MLARRHFDDGRNQQTLARSVSFGDLPHQKLEENPLGRRPAIQEYKPFIALENQITIANHSHEAKSCSGLRLCLGTWVAPEVPVARGMTACGGSGTKAASMPHRLPARAGVLPRPDAAQPRAASKTARRIVSGCRRRTSRFAG